MSKRKQSRGREAKGQRDKSKPKSNKRQAKNQLNSSKSNLIEDRFGELEQNINLRLKSYDNLIKERFEVQETKIRTMAKLVSLIQELVDSKFSGELFQVPVESNIISQADCWQESSKIQFQEGRCSFLSIPNENISLKDNVVTELQRSVAELQEKTDLKLKKIEDVLDAMSLAETHINFIKEVHHLKKRMDGKIVKIEKIMNEWK